MGSRLVYLPAGTPGAGLAATVYADQAGTTLADIAEYQPGTPGVPGAAISGSQVSTDGNGLLPLFWFPNGSDRLWVTVDGGPLTPIDADYNARIDAIANGVTVRAFGAVGDGTTDDAPAIQAALDDAGPGQTVHLPAGRYALATSITVPPMVTLRGVHGNRTDNIQTSSVLAPTAAFTGTAVIRLLDKEEGGYATENEGVRLVNLTIDGASAPASVHGVRATGRVHGAVLDRVAVQDITGRGFSFESYTRVDTSTTKPFSNNLWQCMAREVGSDGFWLGSGQTDCTLHNCEALGAGGDGFVFNGCQNTQVIGCRAEWSDLNGFKITGSGWGTGQGSGGLAMTGCTTDRNSQHGVLIDSTGSSAHLLTGLMLRRDGRNGGSGGGGYAALRVSSATTPVAVAGMICFPGVDDGGTGTNSPQYGVSAAGSTAVVVESGYLHAATTVWHDGGTNTLLLRGLSVVGATGTTGSPTRETVNHLDVTGRSLGVPSPRDHELVAWTYDPALASSGKAAVNGTVHLAAVYVARPAAVTTIRWGINSAGATPTASQNWVGVYNAAGTLLGSTNVDAAISSTGVKSTSLSLSVTPGLYWVAFVFNAATPPQLYRAGDINATLTNVGISSATRYRFATAGTSQTTLPASITPSANSVAQFSYWAALS